MALAAFVTALAEAGLRMAAPVPDAFEDLKTMCTSTHAALAPQARALQP